MNEWSYRAPDRHRTTLAVAAIHAVVLLTACLPGLLHRPPPPLLRVRLASPAPAESNPAPPPSRDTGAPPQPNPTQPPPPRPRPTNNWQARSVEEIRRNATLDPVERTVRTTAPPARNPAADLSELREALRRETDVDVTVPQGDAETWDASRYATAVRTRLYGLWRQPPGTPGQTARARLRVDRNGRILEARLLGADTAAMRQSVLDLLNALNRLPAPDTFGITQATITLPIVFRLQE